MPLLLQPILEGSLGLVHAAFRAFGVLALLVTGYLVLSGLRRRPFDLLAYVGHVDHPSLRRVYLFVTLPTGVCTQPSMRLPAGKPTGQTLETFLTIRDRGPKDARSTQYGLQTVRPRCGPRSLAGRRPRTSRNFPPETV